MGDHQERKMGMPPLGFTSVVLPQPHQDPSSKLPSLSGANDQTDGGYRGSSLQIAKQNLDYSHTQIRDSRGDSDSDSESESDPDLDPATLLATRMASSAPYFKTLSQPQPQPLVVSPPPVEPTVIVRYRECQKNHAAAMGAHVVDGCGEFMPNGEEGTAEALKCAACSCHRNFHRREVEGEANHQSGGANGNNNNSSSRRVAAALHNHHQQQHQVSAPFPSPRLGQRFPPLMMAFGGGGNGAAAESSSEPLNSPDGTPGTTTTAAGTPSSSSRKRFRTKFSQEQKDRMQEFGERLGWKIQKQDEQQVQEFCAEVGVKRQVFKVWMHNSKQASKKREL